MAVIFVISAKSVAFGAHYVKVDEGVIVKVHIRYLIYDEFLIHACATSRIDFCCLVFMAALYVIRHAVIFLPCGIFS